MKPTHKSITTEAVASVVDSMAATTEGQRRIPRRQFLQAGTMVGLSLAASPWSCSEAVAATATKQAAPSNMRLGSRELVVQPVLMYGIPQRQPAVSWRPWTGLQSEAAVNKEVERIGRELKELSHLADFPVRVLPVARVRNVPEAAALKDVAFDALLLYAAGAWLGEINALAGLGKWVVFFVRYRSGPYYYWHEGVHDRLLRAHTDQFKHPTIDVNDVVVDENDEILWRLRALYGLKNVLGHRIVCVGGPSGWECPGAPEL